MEQTQKSTRSNRSVTPERAMKRALVLARRGLGLVHPNPAVGAVLVRDGQLVGEGYHRQRGGDHAEIAALKVAGDAARGATMYVTLEPCNHTGKTPPCAPRLVEAGVARVVIAHLDPNPDSGDGAQALRDAGIEVEVGPCAREAAYLVSGFASLMERGRPRFFLKLASTLDGRIASSGGDSRWISSPIARAWVHRRRREADAILVGAGTVRADNPALTVRHVKGRSPDRIVVDSTLSIPEGRRILADSEQRRIVATTDAAPDASVSALEDRGVTVWRFPSTRAGRVDLPSLARKLGEEGYTSVLVEGGGMLAGAMLQAHLADVVWLVLSRTLLLGGGGKGWTQGLDVPAVPRALQLSRTHLQSLGPDWLTTLVPQAAQWWDPETAHV